MSDGCQNMSKRPILKVIATADGHANVRRAFDASGLDKNMPFIADFVMKEIKALGQEHRGVFKGKSYHTVDAVFFVSCAWA